MFGYTTSHLPGCQTGKPLSISALEYYHHMGNGEINGHCMGHVKLRSQAVEETAELQGAACVDQTGLPRLARVVPWQRKVPQVPVKVCP